MKKRTARKKDFSILVVCSGNTCRSPMAEAILRSELRRAGIAGVKVSSAGLDAEGTAQTAVHAVGALGMLGIRARPKKATPLGRETVDEADLILAMTGDQKERLAKMWPDSEGKTVVMSEFSGSSGGEIADPIGGPLEAYIECAARLLTEANLVVPRVGTILKQRRSAR